MTFQQGIFGPSYPATVVAIVACMALAACDSASDAPRPGVDVGPTVDAEVNDDVVRDVSGTLDVSSMPRQCESEGDDCVAGYPLHEGFVCVDEACRRGCDLSAAGRECGDESVCLEIDEGARGYCAPAVDETCEEECPGYCLGGNCYGDVPGEDPCDPRCVPGEFCVLGSCKPLCEDDSDCERSDSERCIVDALIDGVGYCATGCDSFTLGQCPEGLRCIPVTGADGICVEGIVGDVQPYQPCAPGDCVDGTLCVELQEAAVDGSVPSVGRCLPFCDPTLDSQVERDTTCLDVGTLEGGCIVPAVPRIGAAFCMERCVIDDYGANRCSASGDVCTPAYGDHFCQPGGPGAAGDGCDPQDLLVGCDGTSYCEPRGDGTGVCRPYCQPDVLKNAALGCSADEVCVGVENENFGHCRTPCTPDAQYADDACPDGLKSCRPFDRGQPAFCSASGSTPLGESCTMDTSTCEPGAVCVNEYAIALDWSDDAYASGECAEPCELFGDGSECMNDGDVCAVNWFSLNRAVGHCQTPEPDCARFHTVCRPASVCLDIPEYPACVQMCDLDDATTCEGTCEPLFGGTSSVRIGVCN